MAFGNSHKQGTTRLSVVIDYLNESQLTDYAYAVEKAAAEVSIAKQDGIIPRRFSVDINRKLCESLIAMNSDADCDQRNITHVRKLLENYRTMHGLPEDDFYANLPEKQPDIISYNDRPDEDIDVVIKKPEIEPIHGAEYDENEIVPEEMQECILSAVEVGEEITIKQLIRILEDCCEEGEVLKEQDVIDNVKCLIAKGNFEVVKREPYNGHPYMVLRVA